MTHNASTDGRSGGSPPIPSRESPIVITIILGIVVFAIVGLGLRLGANWLESQFPDASGAHANAWIRTRDVGPGDTVAVDVATTGGVKSVIESVKIRLGGKEQRVEGSGDHIGYSIGKGEAHGESMGVVIEVPETARPGEVLPLELVIDLEVATSGAGHTFTTSKTGDILQIPIEIRSPGDRSLRVRFDSRSRGAGLVARMWRRVRMCTVVVRQSSRLRTRPAEPVAPKSQDDLQGWLSLVAIGILAGGMAVALVGEFVFVRRILRTTSTNSWDVSTLLLYLWAAALGLGAILGYRARMKANVWWRARLRAVIGTPPLGDAFRGVVSTLPPSLLRDADPQPIANVLSALEAAGFVVNARVINHDGLRVARITAKRIAARPEELGLEVIEPWDATPLARALATLYGPLEVSSPFTPSTIVDPP